MTKKSQGRIERDLAVPKKSRNGQATNACWDELKQLRDGCLLALANSARIIPILRNQEILEAMDKSVVHNLVELGQVIGKDTTDFRERLEAIHEEHKHLSGGSNSPDDLMGAIVIGERYNEWFAQYNAVVSPSIQQVLTMADNTLAAMAAAKAAEPVASEQSEPVTPETTSDV